MNSPEIKSAWWQIIKGQLFRVGFLSLKKADWIPAWGDANKDIKIKTD